MLSIGKIALGQHRYYEQQVARGWDDYYAGRGEAPGEWVGTGSAALGLRGRASSAEFSTLMAGCDPRRPGVALRSSSKTPSVAALDLTFSAPKSVSVLAAIAGEGVARELVLAHEQALRAALGYLEDTAVQVRRGHDGGRVLAGEGLVAVAYRHRMSRSLDPQLHTHVVAANLARGPDGRFTALHGAALYRAAKTAGYLYQGHLRGLVTERLGLQWGPVRNGAAELTVVPLLVLRAFSTRRREMERAAAGGIGLSSKRGAQAVALATRERKRFGIDTHSWCEEVRARASELGLGNRELDGLLRNQRQRGLGCAEVREAGDERSLGDQLVSSEGLTERANTFDDRVVLQAFAEAARAGASVGELRGRAERFMGRGEVLGTRNGGMTTAELVECERRLIGSALARVGEGTAVVEQGIVDAAIEGHPLTGEQAGAVRTVLSSGDGVSVIEALAGTGKTFTANVLREAYECAGYEVVGVAPTARAARELTVQAGIPARTLDRLLLDVAPLGDGLSERCVVVFDEAGMAPTRTSARLLELAAHANVRVVAIGDSGQLSSVRAGGWLGALSARLGTVRLTQIVRQRDSRERSALTALHQGRPDRYLGWADRSRRIETLCDRADACAQVVNRWSSAALRVGVAEAVMIARDNKTRAALNSAARELLMTLGLLGEQHTYGQMELAVGDRVICRSNDRLIDVDNGMRATVRLLHRDVVVVDTDAGLVRELPREYAAEHLEHAYALTAHGMQGATVEHAFVVARPQDLTAGWSYAALSRARGQTHLIIHEPQVSQDRREFAPIQRMPPCRRAELLARVARRMLERDVEELATDQLSDAGRFDVREMTDAVMRGTYPGRVARPAPLHRLPSRGVTPSA